MSALTVNSFGNSTSGISSVNQALQANPSGQQSLARLTRRGRLARTIVVLSLAVVMVAGFAATSGANVAGSASSEPSYSVVVVAPGETLWSVAAAYASGDVQGLISEIREVNNLKGYDLQAGQRLRVPLNQ
jgi:LysM repeat protein